jgi:transposase
MINIENGRIVDMIYSRESAEVAEWLKTYPNICIVSRDGSTMYAKAISTAHPGAIQVSDRFHLLKGLTDAARQYITGIIATRVRIESDKEDEQGAYWWKKGRNETDLPERIHNATTEKRALKIQKVRNPAAQGLTIAGIVKETGHSYGTVKKYIDEGFNPEWKEYGVNYPSKLKPYTDIIDELLTRQKTFREIEEAIRAHGYAGAASTIRMYATRKRKHNQAAHGVAVADTEVVERKWLLKLLYNPIETVKGITEAQLEKIIAAYPELGAVYHIVRTFKEIVFSKRVDELDGWIFFAKMLDSEDINSYLNGLTRDMAAVKNAIVYDYNNGLAEGSINKIKLYKRIMYGRCNFDTLRCKTMMLEQKKYIN